MEGDDKRGTVYVGKAPRNQLRPRETFTYRPQDLFGLFLYDETFAADMITYMETWEDYYILHFLRQDWGEHLYSKIWVRRDSLRVAIHQLFDVRGEIVAEARFAGYRMHPNPAGGDKVNLPTRMLFLWPHDKLVIEVALQHVKVNTLIPAQRFEPVIPSDYRVKELRLPAAE